MPAKLDPGPELWLANLEVGQFSPTDQALLHQIALNAFKVRSLQRDFFKNHSQDVLAESKRAERMLDQLLSRSAQGGLDL